MLLHTVVMLLHTMVFASGIQAPSIDRPVPNTPGITYNDTKESPHAIQQCEIHEDSVGSTPDRPLCSIVM